MRYSTQPCSAFLLTIGPFSSSFLFSLARTGYKEFAHIPTERLTPTDPLFAPALERMKIATRQYAKRQLKWVEKQLLPVIRQALLRQRQVEKSGEGEDDDGVWVYVVRGGDTDTALGAEILRRAYFQPSGAGFQLIKP